MAEQTAKQLTQLVAQLRAERQEHVDAIAEIDGTFQQLGITATPRKRRGRPPGRSKAGATKKLKTVVKRGKRGSYKQTAGQFILGLFAGGKTLTTAQIVGKWRQAKRGGKADNTLTTLVKAGKLKRENIEGARGSRYSAV